VVDRWAAALWVVLASARMQVQDMRANQPGIVLGVVQPVVLLVVLLRYRELDTAAATRIAGGVALTALWASTIWTAGGILRREVFQGTLAANVTSVRPAYLVLLGKSLGATLRSGVVILATTAVTVAVLRAPVRLEASWWVAIGVAGALASATALGMLLACLFLLTRYGAQLSSALMYPVMILGGMLIPPDVLPAAVRWMSGLISLRWATELLAAGPGPRALAALGALTAAYFVLAVWAFGRVVDVARAEGTLDLA
jgi:ABC-2 type transport system permease protein